MKILYRQPQGKAKDLYSSLSRMGIENCYLKEIRYGEGNHDFTKKCHAHTSYELHLIEKGSQSYETEDGNFVVREGEFLMIPPHKKHKIVSASYPLCKHAILFLPNESADGGLLDLPKMLCVCKEIPVQLKENIAFICSEHEHSGPFSDLLIESRVAESILLLLRAAGLQKTAPPITDNSCDARIDLAKQYIQDNIESPLRVSEVATYCYLSEKQLTRLFWQALELSPAAYIKKERIRHIETLLSSSEQSLREISERMGFTSEYHFNLFFKKYYGMPPGQYRKMTSPSFS